MQPKTRASAVEFSLTALVARKAKAFVRLTKPRLSFLVVFSAIFGFLMAPDITGVGAVALGWIPTDLLLIAAGGFLVTAASNALNQILEINSDKLMQRTSGRPLPQGELTVAEALIFALVSGGGGVLLLGMGFNLVTALLGIIALLLYAFVYTPLKRVGSISVIVGAFPGALPPLIGYTASAGEIGSVAFVLFLIQFLWQFPHFWAIAWVSDNDYRKAGFRMLPTKAGKSSLTAVVILLYTSMMIPVVLIPWKFGMTGFASFSAILGGGLIFTWLAWRLLKKLEDKSALKLMFFSFIYLPLVQITLLIDKF